MYVVTNRVFVHADWQQEFEERFQKRAGQIDKQPGFIRMQILQPRSNNAPYVVYTEWQDEEAFSQKGALEQHSVIISASA